MLDHIVYARDWITKDLDAAGAHREIDAMADQLSPADRGLLGLVDVAFVGLELVRAVVAFLGVPMAVFALLSMVIQDAPAVAIVGVIAFLCVLGGAAWYGMARPLALLNAALLRRIARRARRRSSALDSIAASGSPVPVSVDVEQER